MSFHSRQRRNARRMIRNFGSGAKVSITNRSDPATTVSDVPAQYETLSTEDARGTPAGSVRIRLAAPDLGSFIPNRSALVKGTGTGAKSYQFLVDGNVGAAGPIGVPEVNPVYYTGIAYSG